MKDVKKNIVDICQYGFTEILNNAIDHSASFNATISYRQTYNKIKIIVWDEGIGIFEKIQKDFGLEDPRTALLELSKGKLTSAPDKHAGEGIFFTSRMFDSFSIRSSKLFYNREKKDDYEWLIEVDDQYDYLKGTCVTMEISLDGDWTTAEVFKHYQGNDIGFRKTYVPIKLGKYENEQFVSRSQAKRILARFDKFSQVYLDFDGVETIGQGFADEIFRVFKTEHPQTKIIVTKTNSEIDKMIKHVSN
jgi:anti-sigma regulatory factor (Ser/Thr protein kinase)